MREGHTEWEGYIASTVQTVPHTRRSSRAADVPPDVGGSWYVQDEYDDGNGMWITVGVSRDFSTG